MYLAVFIKKVDLPFVIEQDKQFITKDKVRIINYGWKGGVMIQFTLYDTKFSFICCHLESGQNKVDARL